MRDECIIPIAKGQFLAFPSYRINPNGVNYLRFLSNDKKRELLYYDMDEWKREPEFVMGAIMAAIQNGV